MNMEMWMRRMGTAATIALAGLAAATVGGCECGKKPGSSDAVVLVRTDPPPAYAPTARAFNERVQHLDRVFAWVNLKLTYFDEQGEKKTEDPEGRLQVVRPNKLALSLGKAGQTLFWFGCDPERYWWLDLSDKSKAYAAVGQHDRFDAGAAKRIGLAIRPLDLIRVLGVVPLSAASTGATQWSADGKQLGVTTPLDDRGFTRYWLDPATLVVQEIEIFDARREPILHARHEGFESVEITRDLKGVRVSQIRVPSRIHITHLPTQTEVRMTLTGVRDGPVSDKAFDLDELLRRNQIERVIDLDKRAAQ